MTDQRSKFAAEYRKLYNTAAWKERRLAQLAIEPLCRMCEAAGDVTAANVADHLKPHRGDPDQFYFGDLQSLCMSCHSSKKQRQERSGYAGMADLDGYPTDLNHPQNRGGNNSAG